MSSERLENPQYPDLEFSSILFFSLFFFPVSIPTYMDGKPTQMPGIDAVTQMALGEFSVFFFTISDSDLKKPAVITIGEAGRAVDTTLSTF
jgi:hypothetical protein